MPRTNYFRQQEQYQHQRQQEQLQQQLQEQMWQRMRDARNQGMQEETARQQQLHNGHQMCR